MRSLMKAMYEPDEDSLQSELAANCDALACGGDELEVATDVYMHGCCYLLAAAIHLTYGLPIGAALFYEKGSYSLHHAWVNLPDGRALDIRGTQSFEFMVEDFRDMGSGTEIHHAMPLAMLQVMSRDTLCRANPSMQQALVDMDKFLGAELSSFQRVER